MREHLYFFNISIAGDGGRRECDFTKARRADDMELWQSEDGKIKIMLGLFGWTAYDNEGVAATWLAFRTKEAAALDAMQRGWE